MPIIFHLDLDAFFISVERILNPQLIGKPVIVGGDPKGRGVVAACSYEARKYGLHSAMPIRQAYSLCPEGKYIHGHYEEYIRFSRLVHDLLCRFAPAIEKASIDEFYMDFTGCGKTHKHFTEIASIIQTEILNNLLLPSSIGIASNKTMAKIASDYRKPLGITYVIPGQEREFLGPLPIGVIPGIGKISEEKLKSRGIYKVQDILKIPIDYYTSYMGKAGLDIWRKANGEGSPYLSLPQDQKSISKETTFRENVLEMEELKNVLFELTGKVCQTLRDSGFKTSTISIKFRYSDFQTLTRSKTVKHTDDDSEIYTIAMQLLEKTYTRRVSVRLIGISLSNFTQSAEQLLLFDQQAQKKKDMLKAINHIRAKYGYGKIRVGVQENISEDE